MGTEKFEVSKTTGIHSHLAKLVGEYKGTSRVWFEPVKVEDESATTGSMKLILDGRFILHEYKSAFKGTAIEGIAIIGYDIANGCFQTAWVDSFHTGTNIMFSESSSADKLFSALGSYGNPPERWGWRTEIEMPEDNKIILTAYNISPEGEEVKATETVYQRV